MGVHRLVVGLGTGFQPEFTHHDVLSDCLVSDGFGPATGTAETVIFHVPQAVLSGSESLGEKSIQLGFRFDSWNAVSVSENRYSSFQSF